MIDELVFAVTVCKLPEKALVKVTEELTDVRLVIRSAEEKTFKLEPVTQANERQLAVLPEKVEPVPITLIFEVMFAPLKVTVSILFETKGTTIGDDPAGKVIV